MGGTRTVRAFNLTEASSAINAESAENFRFDLDRCVAFDAEVFRFIRK
jgi:hypothetical protein